MTQNLPEDELINVSRNNQVTAADGTAYPLQQDWNNLNWQYCLDHADAVVIEFVEPEIINYTYGFLTYLDQFLDTYEPTQKAGDGSGSQTGSDRAAGCGRTVGAEGAAWLYRPFDAASGKDACRGYDRDGLVRSLDVLHGRQRVQPFFVFQILSGGSRRQRVLSAGKLVKGCDDGINFMDCDRAYPDADDGLVASPV